MRCNRRMTHRERSPWRCGSRAATVTVHAADTDRTSIEISGYDKATPPSVRCEPVGDGFRVMIEHRSKRGWGFSFGRGPSFEMTVPTGSRIDGSTASAELEVSGALGSLEFRTGLGRCRVR